MSMSHNAKRSWAFLASAAVGLSGIAATPALANQPAPTAQIVSEQAPAAASQSLQDASVDWGVKSSFRRYITGPVAGGSQELTGATSNADGSYHFTAAEGTVEADGSYHVKFTGSSVKYTGHHGVLEVTISDLELVIKDGQGSLYANISERPYNGNTTPNPPVQHDHTLIGTFDASSLKNEGGQLTLAASDATKVKLSAEATSVFAGFYQAGQELDALAFSAKLVTKQAPAPEKPADPTPEPTQPAPEPTQPEQPAPEPRKPADPTPEPSQPAPEQSKPAETPAPQPSQTSEAPASNPSKPSEAPSSQPAPQPSQSSEAAKPAPAQPPATDAAPRTDVPKGQGHIIESGNLTWNIRDSFLHYLNTIARGNITVEGLSKNAAGGLDFTSASGSYDEATKTGQINFAGKVHISGHHGQLNSSFENTRLVIKEGKGYLVVDAEALNMQGENRTFKDLVLAEVDLSGATLENNVLSAKNAAVTVTVEGSEAIFAGQYNDADKRAMAPLSFSAKLGSQLVENKVTDTTVKGSNTGSGSANLGNNANAGIGGTNFGGSVNSGGGSSSSHSHNGSTPAAHPNGGKSGSFSSVSKNPAQPVCTPVTVTKQVPVKAANKAPAASADGKVASADLGWGVRDSFRNYIRGGIANGSWDLNGTTYSNNAFQWAKGTGSFKDGKGSISFTGSVHFTGHHGILDTTISNPRLEINGKTAVLYATMVGNDMDGKSHNYGEVALLNVDVSGLQVSGDKISISGAGTTITAEGAKAFAGFYEAGKDMAPLSFSASLSGAQPAGNTKTQATQTVTETVYQGQGCDSLNARGSHGRLAHTGASGVEVGVASGLASLVAGIGAVLYTRRRKSSRMSERSE